MSTARWSFGTWLTRLLAVTGAAGLSAGLAVAAAGPAQAAVPNKWGFAFVDKPSVASVPVLAHQAGSWPAPMHVHSTPGPGKRVFVRFPTLRSGNGVVHVTAVSGTPAWCQALSWAASGPDEVVGVRCYKAGGIAAFVPFTIAYTTSSKGPFPAAAAYGYVHYQPGSGIVAKFNSTGAPVTVTPVAPGRWTVRMLALASAAQQGNVQVTAVNPTVPAKCELQKWAWGGNGQVFSVNCYDQAAAPLKTGWTLSYTHLRAITGTKPVHYAYTFNNKPLVPGPYAPVPAGVNFSSLAGVNTIRTAGAGLSLVLLPRVGALPNTVLVTPFNAGPGFCDLLSVWGTTPGAAGAVTVRDVACYSPAGTPAKRASLITYTAAP